MQTVEEFIASLVSLDIQVRLDGGKLRVNAPNGALLPELQANLSSRKQEIIDFLAKTSDAMIDREISTYPRSKPIPLTFGQQRIWSLAKMDTSSGLYNVPTVFELSGNLDVASLELAITEIQNRHESLRTIFLGGDERNVQQVVMPPSVFVLPISDISRDLLNLQPTQAQRALNHIIESEVRQPFNLERGALWRARLFKLATQRFVLAFTKHHIIFDGMSKSIFLSELSKVYLGLKAGKPVLLPALPVQFADYAVWQHERLDHISISRQRSYWKQQLAGEVSDLVIPNQSARISGKGLAGSMHFNFPPKLANQLEALGRGEQASLFVILLTGFNILLNRYSGQEDLIVCSPMANRDRAEIENLIGYFNNIIVMRADLSANPSFRQLLTQIRKLSVEAYDNQFIPLQHIANLPNLIKTTLTRAMLSFQETSSRHLELGDALKTKSINIRKGSADFDLAIYLEREGKSLGGVIDFNSDIFSKEAVRKLLERFAKVLATALENPDTLLMDFPSYGKKPHNVEHMLVQHPQIDAAVVVHSPKTGKLHGYMVLNEHDVPDLHNIRAYMADKFADYRVPSSFTPLDRLPLDANGSIDFTALPPPQLDRSRLKTAYVAPRSELEIVLTRIWKKVLWLDHDVGIQDHFRDLGGHSLLSVQLVHEIESQLERPVPSLALAKLDNIENLAKAMENPGSVEVKTGAPSFLGSLPAETYHGLRSHTASWDGARASPESVMVGLNIDGGKQALFWCLQRYQELTQLSKYLGPDQPVYGMRSGNRVMVKTQENIELLAAHYVGEILQVQPHGPYIIGGNCQAAKIAFQIAKQLKEKGHEITLLFLMEKFIPISYDAPIALLFGDKSPYNPFLNFINPEWGWRKYYPGSITMTTIPGGHGEFFREPNVQGLISTIKRKIEEAQSKAFDEWISETSTCNVNYCLPMEAYRAGLKTVSKLVAKVGEKVMLPVTVTNASALIWKRTELSGVLLRNRWLNSQGEVISWVDGHAQLLIDLEPGKSIEMELTITAPKSAGKWVLELDITDEGVSWFSALGSKPIGLECHIEVNS